MTDKKDQLKSTQIVQKPAIGINPDSAVPPGLLFAYNEEIRLPELDVVVERQMTVGEQVDPTKDTVGTVDPTIEFMANIVVAEQKTRYTPEGNLVVDVVLEITSNQNISNYDVRVARA